MSVPVANRRRRWRQRAVDNVVAATATESAARGPASAPPRPRRRSTRHLPNADPCDRQWIAYEIHDGPVQNMIAAQMHLESLLNSGGFPLGETREKLAQVLRFVRTSVEESRRVLDGLRPPVLESAGVVSAIEALITGPQVDGLAIQLTVQGEFEWTDPLLEWTIYRIVQEAINNIRRHSHSTRAAVFLCLTDEGIHLEIRDWGVGFDPDRVGDHCLGLRGILERARLACGRAVVTSMPGDGTRVLVDLPSAASPAELSVVNDWSLT